MFSMRRSLATGEVSNGLVRCEMAGSKYAIMDSSRMNPERFCLRRACEAISLTECVNRTDWRIMAGNGRFAMTGDNPIRTQAADGLLMNTASRGRNFRRRCLRRGKSETRIIRPGMFRIVPRS